MAKAVDNNELNAVETDLRPDVQTAIGERNQLLKNHNIQPDIIRRAWFTLAHLILDEGSRVVDMGCDDGAMTFAMAAMNPKVKFVGLDKSRRKVLRSKEKYQLHNLEYQVGDVASEEFKPESLDAIICSYILHEVYSGSRYNERIVSDALRKHFKMLKKGGTIFIRDYVHPPPDEFVLMEMPDKPGSSGAAGKDISKMSEADLLVWYSEHARPRQDPGCGGFFLEELPPRFPRTRLFRLPSKWAYEFIMRKDDRTHWESELPQEYTFFTDRQLRRELSSLGARVHYAAPHWDEKIIAERFEKSFRLYREDRTPMGPPPTGYITVAVKLPDRKSLHIEERRPSSTKQSSLRISAMRDQVTGRVYDIVGRDTNVHEILPYRVDEDGRLKIFLHDGVARSIANAVPRKGRNIDGRQWSGHMIEPVAVDDEAIGSVEAVDVRNTVKFARDYLGLKPQDNALLEDGPHFFPAPDHIDELVKTYFVEVRQPKGAIMPKAFIGYETSFQAKGLIREMDAQQVLNAIAVGLIPSGRLELQIQALFEKLEIPVERSPDEKEIPFTVSKLQTRTDVKSILQQLDQPSKRFKDIKGTGGQLRSIHSIFVEEGQTRGATTGLSSQDIDFIIHDDQTINTAVVLPLAKSMEKEIHAGFLLEHLPVPQRHNGKPGIITAPSFNLPADITNLQMAKKFIAERFGITPDMVIKLGESYYSHLGLTPQRIFPFGVTVPMSINDPPNVKFLPFYQMRLLKKFLKKDVHFMTVLSRANKYLADDLQLEMKLKSKALSKEQRQKLIMPDFDITVAFAPQILKTSEKTDTSKDKTKAETPEEPEFSKDNSDAAAMARKFDDSVDDLIETLSELEDNQDEPRPEKW